MNYIPVMGLEIHAELLTKSKVFCSCENSFGGEENTRVCPVCCGMPGSLPSLNKNVTVLAVKAGLAVNCTINEYSAFDRKNYFYPDLPKAYQITQFEYPICENGFIRLKSGKKIRIERIHIEEDAGKLIHDGDTSLADYNRCGVPLIEIVTCPDFASADEVCEFAENIALRLKYSNVCDARMEQGSLRVDVNISLMPENSDKLGTRAEIKNLNSTKAIRRAIEYEILRQSDILAKGEKVIQETRRFDDNTGTTKSLRSKENADDYRYFPEPDIPPVIITQSEIEQIKQTMPEMPDKRLLRYTDTYGLPYDDAMLIISDKALSDFYDKTVQIYSNCKGISNLILVELLRCTKETGISTADMKITPSQLAEIVKMSDDGEISKNSAKELVSMVFSSGKNPRELAKECGFIMSSDTAAVTACIKEVLSCEQKNVQDYKNGSTRIFGYLMGQVMQRLGKGANPKIVKELLENELK